MVDYEGGVTVVLVPEVLKGVVESAESLSRVCYLADEHEAPRRALRWSGPARRRSRSRSAATRL